MQIGDTIHPTEDCLIWSREDEVGGCMPGGCGRSRKSCRSKIVGTLEWLLRPCIAAGALF